MIPYWTLIGDINFKRRIANQKTSLWSEEFFVSAFRPFFCDSQLSSLQFRLNYTFKWLKPWTQSPLYAVCTLKKMLKTKTINVQIKRAVFAFVSRDWQPSEMGEKNLFRIDWLQNIMKTENRTSIVASSNQTSRRTMMRFDALCEHINIIWCSVCVEYSFSHFALNSAVKNELKCKEKEKGFLINDDGVHIHNNLSASQKCKRRNKMSKLHEN